MAWPERLLWFALSCAVSLIAYASYRGETRQAAQDLAATRATVAAQAESLRDVHRLLTTAEKAVDIAAGSQQDCQRAMALTYDRLGLPRPKNMRWNP
jgi:hypothetical protein